MSPNGWALKLAWRDGRRGWRRLLLYISASSLGIAALVASGSLRHALEETIRLQAKPLLGADLVVRDRRPFDEKAEAFFASLGFPRLREDRLSTVAFFPKAGAGRLLEVRAVEEGFPFYGDVGSEPAGSYARIFEGPQALLEETVLREFGLVPGDVVQLGRAEFRVAGALKAVPGEVFSMMFSAPRVFIDLGALPATGLLRDQSLSRHNVYFKIDDPSALAAVLPGVEERARAEGWRTTTVAERRASLGRRAGNATRFLKLAALAALLLGGIGVAGVMQAYAKDKRPFVATLRCLGAPGAGAVGVFLAQGVALGAAGTALGAAAGLALQAALPGLFSQFLRIDLPFLVAWRPVAAGAAVGFAVSALFTALPLAGLRHVPPLAALRWGFEPNRAAAKDPAVWALGAALAAVVFAVARTETDRFWLAAAAPAGLLAGGLALAGLTALALRWVKSRAPAGWPYAWRQGLANLFRPQNRAYALVPALGLGAALLFVVSFLQSSVLRQLARPAAGSEPTLALIDVQRDQRAEVAAMLEGQGLPVLEQAPIVSMRIERLKGSAPARVRRAGRDWSPLTHEYRSTYRDTLTAGEEVVAGTWPPAPWPADGPSPVSLEEGLAKDLGVGLGDEIVFNVQGVPVRAAVAALRRVSWLQLRPNFFVVFPTGVLEEAPHFFVLMARAETPAQAAAAQRAAREKAPNVSVVDLRMFLDTLDDYFGKLSLALRAMALFVLAAGALVLAGALMAGRHERLREAAVLRTLGASEKQVRLIHLVEYGLLGGFAGILGLALGGAGGWAVARYAFEIPFRPGAAAAASGVLLMAALSAGTGLFLGRGMLRRPPLEALREEG